MMSHVVSSCGDKSHERFLIMNLFLLLIDLLISRPNSEAGEKCLHTCMCAAEFKPS
jgi:hypothetical protein